MILRAEDSPRARLTHIGFVRDDALIAVLDDGRQLLLPLVWFPRLLRATVEQRNNWRLLGRGVGVHWPDIDEDLSLSGMLRGVKAPPESDPESTANFPGTADAISLGRIAAREWVRGQNRQPGTPFPAESFRRFFMSEFLELLRQRQFLAEANQPILVLQAAEEAALELWSSDS